MSYSQMFQRPGAGGHAVRPWMVLARRAASSRRRSSCRRTTPRGRTHRPCSDRELRGDVVFGRARARTLLADDQVAAVGRRACRRSGSCDIDGRTLDVGDGHVAVDGDGVATRRAAAVAARCSRRAARAAASRVARCKVFIASSPWKLGVCAVAGRATAACAALSSRPPDCGAAGRLASTIDHVHAGHRLDERQPAFDTRAQKRISLRASLVSPSLARGP